MRENPYLIEDENDELKRIAQDAEDTRNTVDFAIKKGQHGPEFSREKLGGSYSEEPEDPNSSYMGSGGED